MRVLVTGGRDYRDSGAVHAALDRVHREVVIDAVIHGAGRGADTLADTWAALRGVPAHAFPAQWRAYGRGAGPIRNQRMLDDGKPGLVVAFPGGRGTADMVRRARRAGVEVWEPAKEEMP